MTVATTAQNSSKTSRITRTNIRLIENDDVIQAVRTSTYGTTGPQATAWICQNTYREAQMTIHARFQLIGLVRTGGWSFR